MIVDSHMVVRELPCSLYPVCYNQNISQNCGAMFPAGN